MDITLVGTVYTPVMPTTGTRQERIAELKRQGTEVADRLAPQLDALKRSGTIAGWDMLWLDGALGVRASEERAASVVQALHGIAGLEHVAFERSAELPPIAG